MKRFNPAANVSPSPPPESAVGTSSAKLVIGQRIHCILYGGMDGIIYEIVGDQKPETISKLGGIGVMGGNADFRIVFTGERAHLSTVPESIVLGSCQWSIEEGIANATEIKQALEAAEAKKRTNEAEQSRQSQERANKRATLPKLYPWLKTIQQQNSNGIKSSHALGAANLKTELTREFPGVKFSVKSESYSGGDAIRVHWDFGPTTDEVAKFTDKYSEGHFDGMTDSYDYNHDNVWPDVFGGAKYVTESRHFRSGVDDSSGTDFYEKVGRELCALQHVEYEGAYTRHLLGPGDDRDLSLHINGLLHATHFPVGAKFKGVEFTPDSERAGNHWCRIVFELPPSETAKAASPGVSAQVVETLHTKTKIKLFVVQLGMRVERATYERLNQQAKELGGYYSSYRRDGAIPGFIFKVREQAEKFAALADDHQSKPEPPCAATIAPALQASSKPPPMAVDLAVADSDRPPMADSGRPQGLRDWRRCFLRN
jgi:Large polyvalent protein associated domain 30/Large polyvalent protein associated domain 29